MKKITTSIIALVAVFALNAQTLDRSVRPKPGPAPEIKLGKSESFILPNGLKVFVVENHKLPTFSASIQFDINPELQTNMAGFHDLMSELLTAGTKTRSKEELNKQIDFIGAEIDASEDGLSARGLKKHIDKIFDLMSDIALNAVISQEELDKTKTQTLSALEAGKNEPDAMLANVSAVVNYGQNHPYGEMVTEQTVKNITLERCQKYYQTYFRPNVAYMAIVGDVTVAEIKPLIEKYFGKWEKATVPSTTYVNPAGTTTRRVAFVPRDAAVQSVVNVTYPIDLKPGTSDVIKAKVANSILGGGSNGRLFLDLREKHAWTYGSYSSIKQDQIKGAFTAFAKCRNAVSDSSVAAILDQMNTIRTEKVSDEELQNNIKNMSGAFAIGMESPNTIAQYAINIERYKMPKDYYQNYLKNLAAVTSDDVLKTAKKYIDPEKAHVVVVGSEEEVAAKLVRFDKTGKISYYDNYGNAIQPAEKIAAPTNMTGEEVVKKYIAAIGGEKVIRSIADIKTVSTGEIQGQKLSFTEMKKAGGKYKAEVSMGGMTMQKFVVNETSAYQEAQGQKMIMEGDDLAKAKEEADIYADIDYAKYGIKYTLKGMEKVGDKNAYVVESVDAHQKKATSYYDASTYFLVKQTKTEEGPDGEVAMSTEFDDYKEIPGSGGYKIPYSVKVPLAPGMSISSAVESVEVNKNIADTEFQ